MTKTHKTATRATSVIFHKANKQRKLQNRLNVYIQKTLAHQTLGETSHGTIRSHRICEPTSRCKHTTLKINTNHHIYTKYTSQK